MKYQPTIDAEESYLFSVLAEDAVGSVVGDKTKCAAACALQKNPNIEAAEVRRTITRIKFSPAAEGVPNKWKGMWVRFRTPGSLQRHVEGFDTTAGFFPPGDYEVAPISKSQRLDTLRARGETGVRDGSNPGRKRPKHAIR